MQDAENGYFRRRGARSSVRQDDDDILIGDSTAYDADADALGQIITAWGSGSTFADRSEALEPLLAMNIADDSVRDQLWGGSGRDWFLDLGLADVIKDFSRGHDRRSR